MELHTAKYITTHAHANHNGTLPLLVIPICLLGDATNIDSGSRFKLEKWSFSLLIFNEVARRNHRFWGMLGYVKDLTTTSAKKVVSRKAIQLEYITNNSAKSWHHFNLVITNSKIYHYLLERIIIRNLT